LSSAVSAALLRFIQPVFPIFSNVNIIGGVNQFSGYQGGGGAVQVTAGNVTIANSALAGCTSYQETTEVDIGGEGLRTGCIVSHVHSHVGLAFSGGAVSCMDQASTLAIFASGFGENTCLGCR
jgi:hypothetical protein